MLVVSLTEFVIENDYVHELVGMFTSFFNPFSFKNWVNRLTKPCSHFQLNNTVSQIYKYACHGHTSNQKWKQCSILATIYKLDEGRKGPII